MSILDQFVIPLKGLKEGISEYTFEVKKEFFEHFENSEIQNSNILVKFILKQVLSIIEIDIVLSGNATILCDRCLDKFDYEFDHSYNIFLKIGEKGTETDPDIIFIEDFDQNFNVAQYIYEYIDFSFPLQKIHPNDEEGNSLCNEEMLDKLEDINFNKKKRY